MATTAWATTPFPTNITDGAGNAISISYDYNAGKPVSVRDARGNTTTYRYSDAFERATSITEPNGALSNLSYSPNVDAFASGHSLYGEQHKLRWLRAGRAGP
jgi:YD repeat-containing protein